jgi:hypothetical protein
MQINFTYNKAKVIQALRYHFISKKEIRVLMILVNVFAVVSAILFYLHKVRPEPFLLSAVLWLAILLSIWYILPYSIYRKSDTFKTGFSIKFTDDYLHIQNSKGEVNWAWNKFTHFIESPNFFHLYFNDKAFFLIPKDDIVHDDMQELRAMFNVLIPNQSK